MHPRRDGCSSGVQVKQLCYTRHNADREQYPPGRASALREAGALSDFDNVTVRIADVTANLAVLGYRFRDELGSSTFP